MSTNAIKNTIMIILSAIGGLLVDFVGGADAIFKALIVFMIADYISGLAVALVFHKSRKTKNGCASSQEGYKGIVKKLCMAMLVGIAHVLDEVIGVHCLRDVTISFFLMNEGLSLLENLGLMGIKYPAVLTKALEVLCDEYDSAESEKHLISHLTVTASPQGEALQESENSKYEVRSEER